MLRCPDGHLVEGIKSGPLWATGINSLFKALLLLSVITTALQGHWISWVVLGGFLLWSAYLIVRAIRLPKQRVAMKEVAAQFIVIGIVRMGAAIVIGWYVWEMLQRGGWPVSN